jgi:hypothetical protein
MTPRIRFAIKLVCQPCWVLGDAEVSEDGVPGRAHPDLRVEYCPASFRVIQEGGTLATTRIVCAACGEVVRGH